MNYKGLTCESVVQGPRKALLYFAPGTLTSQRNFEMQFSRVIMHLRQLAASPPKSNFRLVCFNPRVPQYRDERFEASVRGTSPNLRRELGEGRKEGSN